MMSRRRDVTKGIQPRVGYQFASPVEHCEVDENTNVDVFEEIKENYPRSFEYAKAHVIALDEVLQSYSYQRSMELYQTKHVTETRDHEFVDLKMIKLLSKVCAFYEEKKHVITDCHFVTFHIKTSIIKHVEL
jgi:hypothetical protein